MSSILFGAVLILLEIKMSVEADPGHKSDSNILWVYTLAWVPMTLIAILNGTARALVYDSYMSELTAHRVSSVTGVCLFAA